jgi:molybdopterin-synthase adenylyltransferase
MTERTLTDLQLERYQRHVLLREIGGAGQKRLLASKVLVCGAGGLGAPVLLYLAAAGVGRIAIADDDRVSLSNLQRQVLFETGDLGRLKVEAAAGRLAALNPDCAVTPVPERLTEANAARLIAGCDLVIDGTDNFETRFLVNRAAVAARVPLLSGAVGEFDGQIAVFDPTRAGPEPGPCYQCFTPEPPADGEAPRCTEQGVAGALTGVIGSWMALEALKLLAGFGESLAGRLVLFDGLRAETRTVRLRADPACPVCAHQPAGARVS